MTDSQRKALFDALCGDLSMFAPGDIARCTLEEAAAKQLEAIEPIVEQIRVSGTIRERGIEMRVPEERARQGAGS